MSELEAPRKRKRVLAQEEEPELESDADNGPHDQAEPVKSDKKKKRKKAKAKTAADERPVLAKMDASLLADYFSRQIRRFEPELTSVEYDDRRIPESAFVDTSEWAQERTLHELPAFLERFSGKSRQQLRNAPEEAGSPHTLIISAAALRAADLTRGVRVYQTKDATVAKLFAKHIKLADAVAFSSKTRMGVAVGTPQRLEALLNQGALSASKLQQIVLDGSHTDAKNRGLLDSSEAVVPLARLCGRIRSVNEDVRVLVF